MLEQYEASIIKAMLSVERRRSNLGAMVALLWEVCITTDREVNFMWLTPFAPLKILYFFTRYYALIILLILNSRPITRTQWIILESISAILLEVATEVILVLRLRVMYSGNRTLSRSLFGLMAVQVTVMVFALGFSVPKLLVDMDGVPSVPMEMIGYSIASILYESLLFALVVYKFVTLMRSPTWNARHKLLDVLIRDSVWAFAAIFVVMFTNTVLFTIAPCTLGIIGFPWTLAILGSVGPRLIVNLRATHARLVSLQAVLVPTQQLRYSTDTSNSARDSITATPLITRRWDFSMSNISLGPLAGRDQQGSRRPFSFLRPLLSVFSGSSPAPDRGHYRPTSTSTTSRDSIGSTFTFGTTFEDYRVINVRNPPPRGPSSMGYHHARGPSGDSYTSYTQPLGLAELDGGQPFDDFEDNPRLSSLSKSEWRRSKPLPDLPPLFDDPYLEELREELKGLIHHIG